MARKGGKGSRARSKLRRKKEQQSRKASRQAQYERWRDLGVNKKSKCGTTKGRKGPRVRKHVIGNCGNPGCRACYSIDFKPFLRDGVPHRMPPRLYKMYLEACA